MKKIVLGIIIAMSVSLAGCERMKTVEWKVWEKWKKEDGVEVVITNLTEHIYITPLLVVGHGDRDGTVFEFGQPASAELQAVAEGGNIEPLAQTFEGEGVQVERDPNEGLLGPGDSTAVILDKELTRISLFAMMLPTNDGFIALDNALIRSGEQLLYAIDAGTEGNDESVTGGGAPGVAGIPADPNETADSDAPGISGVSAEGAVDRHPGISGGEGSALGADSHGWNGAVVSVTITVVE